MLIKGDVCPLIQDLNGKMPIENLDDSKYPVHYTFLLQQTLLYLIEEEKYATATVLMENIDKKYLYTGSTSFTDLITK